MSFIRPYSISQFKSNFNSIRSELRNLLGSDIEKKSRPIKRLLFQILDYDKTKKYYLALFEMVRARSLIRDLKRIKSFDNKIFQKFQKQIKNMKNDDEFFGIRFEIGIMNELIFEKCKNFKKRESPDFVIYEKIPNSYIECTSVHVTSTQKADFKKKIKEAVDEKSKKKYCNLYTALFIDITNIFHLRQQQKNPFTTEELEKYLQYIIKSSNFGSLFLFFYVLETTRRKAFLAHKRLDNTSIDSNLLYFLNKYFPINSKSGNIIVPPRT